MPFPTRSPQGLKIDVNRFRPATSNPPRWTLDGTDIVIRQDSGQRFTMFRVGASEPMVGDDGKTMTFRSLEAACGPAIDIEAADLAAATRSATP